MRVKETLLHCPACGLQTCEFQGHVWPDNEYECASCNTTFAIDAATVIEENHEHHNDQLEFLAA